jgi:ABC-type nickel/cobalt efflux system permease component RcnA
MLITKRSRRKSTVFESRFRDGGAVDFPVRQYLRCREDLLTSLVHALLLAAFLVTLVFFGRTLGRLFDVHGTDLSPWFRRGALALLGLFCLTVLWRLVAKIATIRGIRREMADLKATFRERGD